MNGILSKVFIFAAGAAVGSVVTWKVLETKFNKRMEEETQSIHESLSQMYEEKAEDDIEETEDIEGEEDDSDKHKNITIANGYTYEEVSDVTKPYVIAPEEFGECDYETISLTYYADKVLTDELDDPIDDIDSLIGEESLETFGQYEDDSVFVRNDGLKCDYEILLDERKYSDVLRNKYLSSRGD